MLGIFIHTYSWGWQIRGDERGYIEKVKEYAKLGVDFFTLEREPSLQDGMGEMIYTSLKLPPCPVPPLSISQLVVLSFCSLRATLRRYPSRPIAVYAYNQDIENLWVGYLLKVVLGIPLVVVYHHLRQASFSTFRSGIAYRLSRGFHPIRAVSKSILPALNNFAAWHADVQIALSAATKDDVEKYIGVKDCVVIGNGLDTRKFRPMDLPKEFDGVFLGRLAPQKGVDVLLQAWKEVVRDDPESRLVLIGGGEAKDVALYRQMAKDLSLEGNVKFTGFVSDDEIVRVMGASKVFVFPSRKEGFAQAVSQAMGCGLCCILSDIPSLRGVYGSAATFVPLDQPEALAKRITKLLHAKDERLELGRKARQLAETLSWETAVRGELDLLTRRTSGRTAVSSGPSSRIS
jgi:glycosyltransferase involved in cell wall biosynthesis